MDSIEALRSLIAERKLLEIVAFLARQRDLASTEEASSGLVLAAATNAVRELNALLELGVQPKKLGKLPAELIPEPLTAEDRWTPLQAAAIGGSEQVLTALLAAGATLMSSGDRPPLSIATTLGHERFVRGLIAAGADIEGDLDPPLVDAAAAGHAQVVRTLLDAGAKVDSETGDGTTALQVAAANGHEATCRLLVERGADVDHEDNSGGNAVNASRDRPELHAFLTAHSRRASDAAPLAPVERKADIDQLDDNGQTKVTLAIKRGKVGDALRMLREGADINASDSNGTSPLAHALNLASGYARGRRFKLSEADVLGLVDTLVDMGANMAQRDANGTLLEEVASHPFAHKHFVSLALRKAAGDAGAAARLLGLSKAKFESYMVHYGLRGES